ncbi:GNAT family N-acetyltransferase [Candidatus Woesearchaeota archaeon]|nr:GNAT family N-acetyltransferase [Candidatus Woesearchaeota archaeon]
MKIRKLKKGDSLKELVDLSHIMIKDYEVHHKEFFTLKKRFNKKKLEPHFHKSLESKDMQTFVAEEKGKIIGFITVEVRERLSLYEVSRSGFISSLIVSPEHRRKGIAEKLLKEAIKWLKKKKIKYFDLDTAVKNTGALEFYKKHNIHPIKYKLLGEVK